MTKSDVANMFPNANNLMSLLIIEVVETYPNPKILNRSGRLELERFAYKFYTELIRERKHIEEIRSGEKSWDVYRCEEGWNPEINLSYK